MTEAGIIPMQAISIPPHIPNKRTGSVVDQVHIISSAKGFTMHPAENAKHFSAGCLCTGRNGRHGFANLFRTGTAWLQKII